jgi:cardiolipin synthase
MRLFAVPLLCALAGCASVPTVSPAVGHATVAQAPRIDSRAGPLSPAEIKRIIANVTTAPGENALLQHHLAIEQAVIGGPLVEGETTQLLKNGPPTFRAMFAAIAGARQRIDLEYYIFQDVESDGVHIGDLLLAKRKEGVTINIIYDDFGSLSTPNAFFNRLRQAGVNVLKFNPLNPFKAKAGYKPNDRDHRKILVVDGTTAIVGGVNLATEYQSNPLAKSGNVPGEPIVPWRDTDVQVAGPAVTQLEGIFIAHWRSQHAPPLPDVVQPPAVPGAKGNSVVRFIGSTPDHTVPRYYVTLVSALRSAERSITIEAAYFVPTPDETQALVDAAARGVDVVLIVPATSDSGLALAVGRSHYGQLLQAGVKIYERKGVVLHSKTVTVDGVWSVIGSSNFDHRSIVFNDEIDAIIIGSDTAEGLEAMAAADRVDARQVTMGRWRHRSIRERLKETFGKLVQNLL